MAGPHLQSFSCSRSVGPSLCVSHACPSGAVLLAWGPPAEGPGQAV